MSRIVSKILFVIHIYAYICLVNYINYLLLIIGYVTIYFEPFQLVIHDIRDHHPFIFLIDHIIIIPFFNKNLIKNIQIHKELKI